VVGNLLRFFLEAPLDLFQLEEKVALVGLASGGVDDEKVGPGFLRR